MLTHTFQHIPGVGPVTEKNLWKAGILEWNDVYDETKLDSVQKKRMMLIQFTREAQKEYERKNPRYFSDRLKNNDHWRIFPDFRNTAAYLDIETNGAANKEYIEITTAAVYDGVNIRYYVRGENLDELAKDIMEYDILITFSGKAYDVPIIEREFNINLSHAHIDLRFILKSLGYTGGLKKCETDMGIDREELSGVDGFYAVLLWAEYLKNKNQKALETLLAYNIEDVVNLEILMVKAYNLKLAETPFEDALKLPLPDPPQIPFKPHADIILKIKERIRQHDTFF